MKEKIIVIVGPTASGKTKLAIDLAKKYNGEIVSADSRQVYKGLDVGTEKVTDEEMGGVKHHLIDVVNPNETFTVADFKKLAKNAISEILRTGKVPIIAGGTGFYIDALIYNHELPEVPPNTKLRGELEKKDEFELFELLIEKDPKRAATIDPKNKRRLIRALEIIEALGSVPKQNKLESEYDVLVIGIKTDDEVLHERIEKRLLETCKKGLVQEVSNLIESGVRSERIDEFGLEYKITAEFLRKEISEKEMYQKTVHALKQYAKRQMTWFKRNEDIKWHSLNKKSVIESEVEEFLKRV